jgi:hypothetical protein
MKDKTLNLMKTLSERPPERVTSVPQDDFDEETLRQLTEEFSPFSNHSARLITIPVGERSFRHRPSQAARTILPLSFKRLMRSFNVIIMDWEWLNAGTEKRLVIDCLIVYETTGRSIQTISLTPAPKNYIELADEIIGFVLKMNSILKYSAQLPLDQLLDSFDGTKVDRKAWLELSKGSIINTPNGVMSHLMDY